MSQTLDEFIAEEKIRIDKFSAYWHKNNQQNPENFPILMEDGNEGSWAEMLSVFDDGIEQS